MIEEGIRDLVLPSLPPRDLVFTSSPSQDSVFPSSIRNMKKFHSLMTIVACKTRGKARFGKSSVKCSELLVLSP